MLKRRNKQWATTKSSQSVSVFWSAENGKIKEACCAATATTDPKRWQQQQSDNISVVRYHDVSPRVENWLFSRKFNWNLMTKLISLILFSALQSGEFFRCWVIDLLNHRHCITSHISIDFIFGARQNGWDLFFHHCLHTYTPMNDAHNVYHWQHIGWQWPHESPTIKQIFSLKPIYT